jgi:hypothetical protein
MAGNETHKLSQLREQRQNMQATAPNSQGTSQNGKSSATVNDVTLAHHVAF